MRHHSAWNSRKTDNLRITIGTNGRNHTLTVDGKLFMIK